jgi:flagellar biogenesis protein FliO
VIFSYLLTLFGVCGLAVGSLVVLRAAKGGGLSLSSAQPIRVIGRQALGAGATLMLVEVDRQRMLISVSRGGVSLIESKNENTPQPLGLSLSKPCPSSSAMHKRKTTLRQAQGERVSESFSATLKRAGSRW